MACLSYKNESNWNPEPHYVKGFCATLKHLRSIEGGRTIKTYLDCAWVTTQIMDGHSFRVTPNPDLVIGYMMQVSSVKYTERLLWLIMFDFNQKLVAFMTMTPKRL